MKARATSIYGLLLAPILGTATASEFVREVGQLIPDNDPAGIVSVLDVSGNDLDLSKVTVSLELTGGFNGDLYAELRHDSGFSVLLNRVGRTEGQSFGYLDSGLSVVFDDDAPNGDIHLYREVFGGAPLTEPLTGIWQPDGRTAPPSTAVASDPRTASLANFVGINPNGTWTLTIADYDGGGEATLVRWGIRITQVPEPQTLALAAVGGLSLWILLARRRRLRRDPAIQPRRNANGSPYELTHLE